MCYLRTHSRAPGRCVPLECSQGTATQTHTRVCTHCMCDAQICCISAGLPTSSILSLVPGWKRDGLVSSSLPAGVTHPSAGVGSSAWPQPAGNGSALHTKEVAGQGDSDKLGFRAAVCSPGMEMCFHCGGRAHLFVSPCPWGSRGVGAVGL